jgi:hypothetical protein
MEFSIPRLGWRSLPLLLAGLIAGAFVLSPAVGEAAAFITKKKANRRYLGNNIVASVTVTAPGNEGTTVTVPCPAGRQASGGGVDSPLGSTSDFIFIAESKPTLNGARTSGWNVEIVNNDTNPTTVTAYAVCVS